MSSSGDKPGAFFEWLKQEGHTNPHFHHPAQTENSSYFSDLLINIMGKNTAIDNHIYKIHSLCVAQNVYLSRRAPAYLLRVWDPGWVAERGDWARGAAWGTEGALGEVAAGDALLEEGVHM